MPRKTSADAVVVSDVNSASGEAVALSTAGTSAPMRRWLASERARTAIPYVSVVVALNVGFSLSPEHDWFWSLLVGSVLVLRDFAQRVWGHACLGLMAIAAVLSYLLGNPAVALASATAFAVSETVDWLVYTATRRPFADRVLLSTSASAPIDSTVFLTLAHLFTWPLFFIGVASKCTAGLVIWALLRWRQDGRSAGGDEQSSASAPRHAVDQKASKNVCSGAASTPSSGAHS